MLPSFFPGGGGGGRVHFKMSRVHFKCLTVTDCHLTSYLTLTVLLRHLYCYPSRYRRGISEICFVLETIEFSWSKRGKGIGQTRPDTAGHRRAPLTPQKGTEQKQARRSLSFFSSTWYGSCYFWRDPNFNNKTVSSPLRRMLCCKRELLSIYNLSVLLLLLPPPPPPQNTNRKTYEGLKQTGI